VNDFLDEMSCTNHLDYTRCDGDPEENNYADFVEREEVRR